MDFRQALRCVHSQFDDIGIRYINKPVLEATLRSRPEFDMACRIFCVPNDRN